MASIVLYLDLQSLTTHVNEVAKVAGYSAQKVLQTALPPFFVVAGRPLSSTMCMVSCDLRFDPDERIG